MIYVLRFSAVVALTVAFGTLATLFGVVDRSERGIEWVAHTWIHWVLRVCGVSVEATGLEHIRPDQPAVFMSNHQSHFDVAAIVETLPVPWRFVAKRELVRVPFFGWGLALGGHVIIDRSDHDQAVRSLEAAADRIRGGTNVIIFPEGTRSESGELQEFKSGGFHLAVQAGVPIIPVSVSGSRHITPKRSLKIRGGRVSVVYGKPIPTAGRASEDREALKAEVRRAIAEGLQDASGPSPLS
ncbi:MAG: lysophospholipid acyltransferase family protein [Myxococcota bacterium]